MLPNARVTATTDALGAALEELKLRCVPLPADDVTHPWTRPFPEEAMSLHVVLDGVCLIQTDVPLWSYRLHDGEVLAVSGARGALRALSEGRPPEVVSARIHLEAPVGHPMLATFPRLIRAGPGRLSSSFEPCIHALREEIGLRNPGRDWLIARLCESLFVHALRSHIGDLSSTERGWFRMLADPLLGAQLALTADPSTTVTGLASALGRSPQRIRARFKKLGGIPPSAFLRRGRVRRAAGLLVAGETDLARVAHESGFHSRQALCRAFRREMGDSPAAYWRALHGRPFPRPRRKTAPDPRDPLTMTEPGSFD